MAKVAQISAAAQRKQAEDLLIKNAVALGNTHRTLAHCAADLVNEYTAGAPKALTMLADGAFLSRATVERVGREGGSEGYRPQADTLERIFRYFGRQLTVEAIHIRPKFQNKPKE